MSPLLLGSKIVTARAPGRAKSGLRGEIPLHLDGLQLPAEGLGVDEVNKSALPIDLDDR